MASLNMGRNMTRCMTNEGGGLESCLQTRLINQVDLYIAYKLSRASSTNKISQNKTTTNKIEPVWAKQLNLGWVIGLFISITQNLGWARRL